MEEIRNHQQRLGEVQLRVGATHHRGQLEQRIDLHRLDTGRCEQFPFVNAFEDMLGNAVRPRIAIVIRIAEESSALIQ